MKNLCLSEKERLYLFNRVILAHLELWVQEHIDNDDGEVPDILLQMKTKGFQMRIINGFTPKEIKILKKIESTDEFKEIKNSDIQISYLVHSLVVLKLWIEDIPKDDRPALNIAEDRLKYGKAYYTKHMLLAKKLDHEFYEKEKIIIDNTEKAATKWYKLIKKQILKGECNES